MSIAFYIPEFWVGVIVTHVAWFCIFFVRGLIIERKKKKTEDAQ